MSGHTKEPWRVDEHGLAGYGDNGRNFYIRAGGEEENPRSGGIVAEMPLEHKLLDYGETDEYVETKANARRICLAVNACAGLSDAALEAGVIGMLAKGTRQILTASNAEQYDAAMKLLRDANELLSPEDTP